MAKDLLMENIAKDVFAYAKANKNWWDEETLYAVNDTEKNHEQLMESGRVRYDKKRSRYISVDGEVFRSQGDALWFEGFDFTEEPAKEFWRVDPKLGRALFDGEEDVRSLFGGQVWCRPQKGNVKKSFGLKTAMDRLNKGR